MAHEGVCEKQVLAHSTLGRVDECRCGKVHLQVGPVTLHFELDAFETLACMANAAVQEAHTRRLRATNDMRLLLGQTPRRACGKHSRSN